MLSLLLLPLFSAATAAQQGAATIIQKTGGWCSPAIANVTGNVTVTCIGVDPRALKRLNEELNQRTLQLADKVREADKWTQRYKELEKRLNSVGDDSLLSHRAEKYLHEGELEQAGAVLDKILRNEESQIDRTAANHYNRALVFTLQFLPLDALPHYEKAYQYRPQELEYGLAFASALLDEADYSRAEPVILSNLDRVRQRAKPKPSGHVVQEVFALEDLGKLYRYTDRKKQAAVTFGEALDILKQDARPDPSYEEYLASLLLQKADVDFWTQRIKQAEDTYVEALNILGPLAKTGQLTWLAELAQTLNNLGKLYSRTHQIKKAETVYLEALDVCRHLVKANPAYKESLADTLESIGILYSNPGQFEQAEVDLLEALAIRRELAKSNPLYEADVADTLDSLGLLYSAAQRRPEAEAAYVESLNILRRLAQQNPAVYQFHLANSLHDLAMFYRQIGRTSEAEANYIQGLKIVGPAAKVAPETYRPFLATLLNDLAVLYFTIGRIDESEADYTQALAIRRELANANPDAYLGDLAGTLSNLGVLYDATKQTIRSQAAYQEALDAFRHLAETNPGIYQIYVARTLTNMAKLHLAIGDRPQAAKEIEESISINRQHWRANTPSAADDLAECLIIDAQTRQDSLEMCKLTREAAALAHDPILIDRANKQLVSCTSP